VGADDEFFLAARRAVDRSACDRWLQRQSVDKSDAIALQSAKERFGRLPLLLDPRLYDLALRALQESLGLPVEGSTPFPSMIWYNGATDTYGGVRFTGTLEQFVIHVLIARSHEVAPKRQGWVVTPTSNSDGHRTNASTVAVHALNLDCDNHGDPGRIISTLEKLNLAFIAYESGGSTPSSPKWHLLIPLSAPFDTSSLDKISRWKSAYNSARVVFGALAGLTGDGFDPTVEAPAVPVFITERRSVEDSPREVIWKTGHTLDLEAMIRLLPTVVDVEYLETKHKQPEAIVELDDEKLEDIVKKLCLPMSKILSGRREIYLALPGALLDRGISPEDVLAITEEVSNRCPGDPRYTQLEIELKHKEHIHCAETTIARWESGDTYVRIGTLVERWPEIASAVDMALPNPLLKDIVEKLQERSRASSVQQKAINLKDLKDKLRTMKNHKIRSKDKHEQVKGLMLQALLDEEDFVPYMIDEDGEKELVYDSSDRLIDRDRAIASVAGMVAYCLPIGVFFEAVREVFRPSMLTMLKEGEDIETLFNQSEQAFLFATNRRIESDDKQKERDKNEGDRLMYEYGNDPDLSTAEDE